MSALTITHTHADGTLIDGTARGDGSGEILKAQRWRWSRNLGSWYIQNMRDRRGKLAQINATAATQGREDVGDVVADLAARRAWWGGVGAAPAGEGVLDDLACTGGGGQCVRRFGARS